MRYRRVAIAAVLLAASLPAASASAWSTHTVATSGPATVAAVQSASGRPVSTLYQYRVKDQSTLVLATGSKRTVVARSRGGFDAKLALDSAGRPTVAYLTVLGKGQPRKAFLWTPGRARQLPTGSRSAYGIDVSVAPSGAAVAAWVIGDSIHVVRRAAGASDLGAPQTITDANAFIPRTAITPDGEAIVAWGVRTVDAVRATAGQPFGAPVALPSRRTELTSLAVTSAGRVLLGARAVVPRTAGGFDRASLLGIWDRGDAASTTVPLSTPDRVGGPVQVLARGTRSFVAWRDTGADYKGALLGLGVLDATGALRTRQVHGAGSGSPFSGPAAIAPAGADGARVYIAPYGHAVTARTVLPGLEAGDVEHVSPASERASGVVAATSSGHAVAAWTTAGSSQRVRIATAS